MVRLEVQEHRDLARELMHVLELERRELADHPLRRLDRRQRPADVTRHLDVAASRSKHRSEQLDRRRLSVRARDADEPRAGEESVAELNLAPDRDLARAGGLDERVLAGHARALDYELDPLEGSGIFVVSQPPIGGRHRDAATRERSRSGPTRAREPEHERSRGQLDAHGFTALTNRPSCRSTSTSVKPAMDSAVLSASVGT